MPIHSEADKSSKEVKKAGKLWRHSKQFGLSGDEGNKKGKWNNEDFFDISFQQWEDKLR